MINLKLIFYTSIITVLSLLQISCSAIKAYPDRAVKAQKQLSKLTWCFEGDVMIGPNISYTNASHKDNIDPTTWRNEVVNCRIYAIDLEYTIFEQSIAHESISLNTGVDMAVVGLGAATAIVDSATTKSILGALSGGITGGKGIIDKDVFYSKTMPVLLSQMEAQRKMQLVKIRSRLRSLSDAYPLSEALIDVEDYYKAGSIPAALQGIVEQSGADAKDATQKLKKLQPASVLELMQITDIRNNIFNKLYKSWHDAPTSDEGKQALKKARDILSKLDLNAASYEDSEVFDKLNDQIGDAEPGSDQLKKLVDAFNHK
jgi:hypothetical protein